MSTNETYGDKVARMRRDLGLTQQELADRAGLHLRTLQGVESNTSKKPQRATRLALARVLDIEGDADAERAEWPEDVQLILDIIGAHLANMATHEDRLRWLRDVM